MAGYRFSIDLNRILVRISQGAQLGDYLIILAEPYLAQSIFPLHAETRALHWQLLFANEFS